jgi:hypothetical protein
MNSLSTLVKPCPLRSRFFQRYREHLSLAVQHPLFSHQSSQPVGFQPVRIPRSTNASCNTITIHGPVLLPSSLCQPFNTHRSSIQGRFSPIRF